jgi:phage terminase large subunit
VKTTNVFAKNLLAFDSGKRYVINQGGTRSSKTFSILQLIYFIATYQSNQLISIVSETFPHLKRGVIRDWESILESLNFDINNKKLLNKSDHIYKIGTSKVEFFSADDSKRLRGAARDYLFVNECNNISLMSFNELEVRTRKSIFLDFNPVAEFWVHSDLMPRVSSDKYEFIKSTYKDNTELSQTQIDSIESRREFDPQWWRVYGLGEVGSIEGLIFPEFHMIDSMPDGGRHIYGMDFGFSNDPTTLIDIRVVGDELYLDERLYQTGMTSSDIVQFLNGDGVRRSDEIIADSADPRVIAEINRSGYNCHPSIKGADSVRIGIDTIKRHKVFVTKRSTNLMKEFRNYKYKMTHDGKYINEPIDFWNHCIDAVRYGLTRMLDYPTGKVKSTFRIK